MTTRKSKNSAISDWIKATRKSMNLTQKELAAMLNISKRSLENYESGVVDPSLETALRLAVFGEDPPPPFFQPTKMGQPQNKDVKGDKAVVDEDGEVTAKYISLLEQNVKRLEQETNRLEQVTEELKEKLKKSSKKPKTTKIK